MRKLLYILLPLIFTFTPITVNAMPIASNMITEVEDMKIKSLNGNLFEVTKDNKSSLEYIYNNYDGSYMLNGQKIFLNKFKKEYTVLYKSDDEIIKTDKVLKGNNSNPPETLKKTGYTFLSWDSNTGNIQSNKIINAIWQPIKCNIAFKDGSKVIKTLTLDYDSEIIPPEMQNETERTFIGWDKDLIVKGDMVINAKWRAKEYTVILNYGDYTEEKKVEYMQSITLPSPTKEGYIFVGWDRNGENIIDNTKINALWKKDNNTVQFISNKKPHTIEFSEKIKDIENWILNLEETDKYFADYNLLEIARKNINSKYFYYFSVLNSSLSEDNGKFYLEVTPTPDRIEKNQYIEQKIKEIAENIFTEGMGEEEAISNLYNWFQNNLIYEKGQNSLYDSLKDGKGNCDAYSQIAQALLDYAGIDCRYITGEGNGGYHAWNKIKINNEWYYADFTWNYPLNKEVWTDHVEGSEKSYFEK